MGFSELFTRGEDRLPNSGVSFVFSEVTDRAIKWIWLMSTTEQFSYSTTRKESFQTAQWLDVESWRREEKRRQRANAQCTKERKFSQVSIKIMQNFLISYGHSTSGNHLVHQADLRNDCYLKAGT